jgi:Secretion system C-terminal sorting domain
MAFIRNCFLIAVFIFCALFTAAQTIHYPLRSSQLLRSTADDVAMLLKKAIPSGQFNTQSYSAMPSSGIILVYDSTITDNQLCRVESNGINLIKFTAAQDNGLHFGLYQYLRQLGFRFYQPGTIWEMIPLLSSAYKNIDTIYTSAFKYKSWLISGGHNRWIMDNNANYGWDTYFGENGHNWALYQRRNGMTGAHGFSGHRGDIMTGNYLATLQANPCYVAAYNNSRTANAQSVPDVNNNAAMNLWSSTIEQKYTQYRNAIFGNVNLYVNQSRNYNYSYENIGIEVPDGAKWGNSKDNTGCGNTVYSKESDQQFALANFTAQKLNAKYPQARFQLYAYSTHADVPSPELEISKNIDVQLVPAVYQNITSTNGLRNRWYNRTKNISEYNYFNLSGWSGETPAFYLADFKATVQIAKDKKSQGLMWESSPAKFGSLPFLLAANSDLKDNIPVDNSLREFCDNMFEGAGKNIYALLQLWTDNTSLAGGTSNRYKVPLYLKMLSDADQQLQNAAPVVKERMRELKAYVHYMIMYYDWTSDQRPAAEKAEKAAALCIYLAKTNKMQLVNSYFLIATIISKYPSTGSFYQQYNHMTGTAYQNGNLALLTSAEIDNNFQNDKARYGNIISDKDFKFETASTIKDQFNVAGLSPVKKINVRLNYTNGLDYYNRSEFFIKAPAAGSFTIQYSPRFDMPDKGYINFLVESADKALEIITDVTLDRNAKDGTLLINLPSAGTYKLSVYSKYKSGVDLDISTNKNYFYKNGAFLGTATEIYQSAQPGYFYVPKGIDKVYFSINNSNAGGNGFASAEKINNAFAIKDSDGNTLPADFVAPSDSALFYMNIPKQSIGKFCKVSKMAGYGLVFSNIGNILWFAEPKPKACANADFTVSIVKKNSSCITRLTAVSKDANLQWEVSDMGRITKFENQTVVDLPDYSSPNALITLTNGEDCSVTKKLADDPDYLKGKQYCASGAALPVQGSPTPVLYPNPSTGVFNCMQNGSVKTVDEITITSAQGVRVGNFRDVKQLNIAAAPAGIYMYKMVINGAVFTGKLVKL